MTSESSIKSLTGNLLYRLALLTGVQLISRKPKWDGALILMGHRVNPDQHGYLKAHLPEWFEQQISYLALNCDIIGLGQLLDDLENERKFPDRPVVLTFDDGFVDNFIYARPILKKYNATATIFLPTESIENGKLPWPQRLEFIILNTKILQFTPQTSSESLLFGSSKERYRSYRLLFTKAAQLTRVERDAFIDTLAAALEVTPPLDSMLTWSQIKTMANEGFEFGGHTYSHPLLTKIPLIEAEWEINKCYSDLHENLGLMHPSFAFPGGDYNMDILQIVRNSPFRSVFQSNYHRRYNNPSNSDPYYLSRYGMPTTPLYRLKAELEIPFIHTVRKLFRRRRNK